MCVATNPSPLSTSVHSIDTDAGHPKGWGGTGLWGRSQHSPSGVLSDDSFIHFTSVFLCSGRCNEVPQTGWLPQQFWRLGVLVDSILGGNRVFLACRWLPSCCSHDPLGAHVWGEEEEASSLASPLVRALIPSRELHPRDLIQTCHLPKAPPPDTITLGIRASAHEF